MQSLGSSCSNRPEANRMHRRPRHRKTIRWCSAPKTLLHQRRRQTRRPTMRTRREAPPEPPVRDVRGLQFSLLPPGRARRQPGRALREEVLHRPRPHVEAQHLLQRQLAPQPRRNARPQRRRARRLSRQIRRGRRQCRPQRRPRRKFPHRRRRRSRLNLPVRKRTKQQQQPQRKIRFRLRLSFHAAAVCCRRRTANSR